MDETDNKRHEDRDGGGYSHGVDAGRYDPNQNNKRNDEIAVLQQVDPGGKFVEGDAFQAAGLCLQMHGAEDAAKVQKGGDDGDRSNLNVGDAHIFSHKERSSAHDGGHDLATRRGFNSACEFGTIAGLLHHWDGYRASGNGIANRRTRNHAAQRRGDYGNLCWATGRPTSQAVCEADEEVRDTGTFEEGAENDKQHDVGVAHVGRGADNAASGVEELLHDVAQCAVCVCTMAKLPVEGVD